MGKTSIEWAHYTFNPWRGCTKVSDGCKFCYADRLSDRNPKFLGIWGPNGTRVIGAEAYFRLPFKWNQEAKAAGERRRVFCASLADFFEGPESMPEEAVEPVQLARGWTFQIIDATPWLDWLLVTKRPENIRSMWPGGGFMPPVFARRANVWLLTSVEDQATADKRIPELLKCRDLSPVLGLSMEPLLGKVDLKLRGCASMDWDGDEVSTSQRMMEHDRRGKLLDWVIAGGESGSAARPMHPDWPRSLRNQCQQVGVPFFFKQWGEFEPGSIADALRAPVLSSGPIGRRPMNRVGKKAAGRQLDGRTWDELPLVKS